MNYDYIFFSPLPTYAKRAPQQLGSIPPAPFWMVWNPNGAAPKVKHKSQAEAVAEAKRLASANPGQSFFVIQAMSEVKASKPEVVLSPLYDGGR